MRHSAGPGPRGSVRFAVVGLLLVAGASVALATVWDDGVPLEEVVATLPAIEPAVAPPTAQPTPSPQPTPTPLAKPTATPEAEPEELVNTDVQEVASVVPDEVQDEPAVVDPVQTATPTPEPTTAPTPHSDPTPTPEPHTHPDPAPTPHEDPTPQADDEEAPHAHPDPTPTSDPTATPEATAEPTEDPAPTPEPAPVPEDENASGAPTAAQWAALRQCESGGNYSIVSSNGLYRGAYQFAQGTWNSTAGSAWPELVGVDPAEAAPADQDKMALRLYELRGVGPWPVCGQQLL